MVLKAIKTEIITEDILILLLLLKMKLWVAENNIHANERENSFSFGAISATQHDRNVFDANDGGRKRKLREWRKRSEDLISFRQHQPAGVAQHFLVAMANCGQMDRFRLCAKVDSLKIQFKFCLQKERMSYLLFSILPFSYKFLIVAFFPHPLHIFRAIFRQTGMVSENRCCKNMVRFGILG